MSLDLFFHDREPELFTVLTVLFVMIFALWMFYKVWEFFCAIVVPISWFLLLIVLEAFVWDGVFMDKAYPGILPWFSEVARGARTPRDVLYLFALTSLIVGLFSSGVVFLIFIKNTVQVVRTGRLKFWSK